MRQVVCTSYHGRIDDENCDPENRPIIEQDCNIAPCQTHNHFPGNHNYPMLFPQPESPQKSRENDVHNSINQKNKPARGNQWRTGPWGAVSYFTEFGMCEFSQPYISFIAFFVLTFLSFLI